MREILVATKKKGEVSGSCWSKKNIVVLNMIILCGYGEVLGNFQRCSTWMRCQLGLSW